MHNNIDQWPIVKLTEDRDAFLTEVIEDAMSNISRMVKNNFGEEIAKAMYLEKIRLIENPWNADPKSDRSFWSNIKKRMLQTANESDSSPIKQRNETEIAREIVSKYTHEIAGKFSIPTYKFARHFVPFLFARLLNTASNRKLKRIWSSRHRLEDRIVFTGEIDHLRKLSEKGTVVLVPTHFSNLDSILVGYALDELGLPPFVYGAGLNLYNNSIVAFFINKLGAYKVDRRKKNMIYLETLKSYSRISMQRGCHSLFFPGGTRSRSGALETKLKLGLLGTAFDAQLNNYQKDGPEHAKKIFVVPLVIGYHFVLEADSLIQEHLKATGKEKYFVENDQFSSWYRILKFLWDFFARGTKISLSFGKPLDLFGNYVDLDGKSLDPSGKTIDVSRYFYSGGELKSVPQRDQEYTRLLGERIVQEYFRDNTVLSSHLVAYASFEMLLKKFPKLDVYGVLRLPEEEREIQISDLLVRIENIRQALVNLSNRGEVKLSEICQENAEEILTHGLRNIGLYHSKRVLYKIKDNSLSSENLNLLYYYHNRLEGYGLRKHI